MKQSIDLIDEILAAGGISDAYLRMLVQEIDISEKDEKLTLSVNMPSSTLYPSGVKNTCTG